MATGTTYILDETTATQDYNSEIELSWAYDLEQQNLIDAVQEEIESDPNVTRLGFLVKDDTTPDEVKGVGGETIDLMAMLTLMRNAMKAQQNEIDKLKLIINP